MLPFKFHLIKPKEKKPLSELPPPPEQPPHPGPCTRTAGPPSCPPPPPSLSPLAGRKNMCPQPLSLLMCLPQGQGGLDCPPPAGPSSHTAGGPFQRGRTGRQPALRPRGPGTRQPASPLSQQRWPFSLSLFPGARRGVRTAEKASRASTARGRSWDSGHSTPHMNPPKANDTRLAPAPSCPCVAQIAIHALSGSQRSGPPQAAGVRPQPRG